MLGFGLSVVNSLQRDQSNDNLIFPTLLDSVKKYRLDNCNIKK